MTARRAWCAAALVCDLVAVTSFAHANGRYPAARSLVVGPGSDASVLALETTFGIALSLDSGASWSWLCEAELGFAGEWDPPPTLTRTGALVVGLPTGLGISSHAYCQFDQPAGFPALSVVDLTVDVRGARMIAAYGEGHGVARSDDDGVTWTAGAALADTTIETVDIAPGAPDTVYVSGSVAGGQAVLQRSSDGGDTFTEATRDFPDAYAVYIAAVDPAAPGTLYVRANLVTGATTLLRSTDGGASFHELTRTAAPMTGAAFDFAHHTLWVGSTDADAGIARSTDDGATWTRVPTGFAPLCLRYQAGALYACADDFAAGFALATSTDGGDHFTPRFTFAALQPPSACPAGTPGQDQCVPAWSAQQMLLGHDAGMDAAATDAAAMDGGATADAAMQPRVDAAMDAGGAGPSHATGCHCRAQGAVGGAAGRSGWRALGGAALGAVAWRGRRRARG